VSAWARNCGEAGEGNRSINVAVIHPLFLGAFLGTAVACAFLGIWSLFNWPSAGSLFRLAGSLFYLVGTMVGTIVFHLPRNEALAALDPGSPGAAEHWTRYQREWAAWNHVRTATALLAAALLTLALSLARRGGTG
jgi:uncharacterized membrane protein